MRVLLTADTFGGVWTYACELVQQLSHRGCEVVVAALGRAPTADQRASLRSAEVVVYEGALEWMPDPWQDVEAAGDRLLELAEVFEPDVVHVNGYAHAALPFAAPVVVVAHSCVLSWFDAVHATPAPKQWRRYRSEVERGLRAADAVVAPTHAMLAALRRHYAFDTPTHVILNGRTMPRRRPKRPLVVSAGRVWDEAKNIAAIERVSTELPWPVRIAGDGSASGRVPQPVLERWLGDAAIFALPARYEPFGLGILEAAGAACALVLGDIDSLREVWRNAAVYVDPGDDADIARALRRLIADPTRCAQLGAAAHERARRLTPERMAADYLALYDRVCAPTPRLEHV